MKRKKLLIISHTEHFYGEQQQVVGWGATVNEVNYLADYWDEVVHIGCLYDQPAPKSALPYVKSNIRFEPIPPYGGKSLIDKIRILFKIPSIIAQVRRNVKGATEVQLRLPTSMGLFLLPLFSFFLPRNFTFWVKYAGNWNEQHPPLSYRIQRWWLKKHIARCKVTLNGFWKDQPPHCFSFENPCLTQENIAQGKRVVATKVFEPPFTFAFVGRLEDPKGVSQILEAFKDIPFDKVEKLHFIGDGENFERYKSDSGYLGAKVVFHGFQSTPVVHEILAASHFFLLPSLSEGFPKVIAEAACYGCIPVVSDVGSIAHYVNSSNGFLWELNGNAEFIAILHSAIVTDRQTLNLKSEAILDLAVLFTFEHYFAKLDHLLKNNS